MPSVAACFLMPKLRKIIFFLLTRFKMQILGWEAGEEVSLIAHGAEVAVGSVEHCEVAAVVVRAVDSVVIEGAHGRAGSLGDAGAGIYPVHLGNLVV